MIERGSKVFVYVLLIFTLLLAACGGGNGAGNATGEVPGTGQTPDVGAPTEAVATEAATEVMEATEATAGETPTEAAGGEATPTEAAGADATPTEAAGGTGPVDDPLVWTPEEIGGTVTVLAIWGGEELNNFNAMIEPFQQQTGIRVQVETTRDLGAVLNTRISGGNPPDVAGLPNPGQLTELARAGSLVPLDDVLDMDAYGQVYDAGFTDLAAYEGQTYGIWTKAAVKSLVWYNPKAFEANGLTVPTNWDELQALEQQIVDLGKTPWCVGIDGGAGSGWPGTDWVEDFMLRTGGPDVYDQWYRHEIPWTDPQVVEAFTAWGEIVNDETMVYGGPQAVVATNFGEAFVPMFEDDPGCFLHRQASFITTFFEEQFPDLVAGEDYNFFPFPAIEGDAPPLLVAGDLFGMFNDTPQARALIQYMVTAQAQSIWAERGGFLSANRAVDPTVYPDEITQQIAESLVNAPAVRFDASDLMPQAVNSAFSTGVLNFAQDGSQLDSVLQSIEAVAADAYVPAQ